MTVPFEPGTKQGVTHCFLKAMTCWIILFAGAQSNLSIEYKSLETKDFFSCEQASDFVSIVRKEKKKGRALLRVEKTLPCSCNSNKSKRVSPCFSELKIENNSVIRLITSHCTNPAFCMVLRGFPVIYKQVSCSYFLEEMRWSRWDSYLTAFPGSTLYQNSWCSTLPLQKGEELRCPHWVFTLYEICISKAQNCESGIRLPPTSTGTAHHWWPRWDAYSCVRSLNLLSLQRLFFYIHHEHRLFPFTVTWTVCLPIKHIYILQISQICFPEHRHELWTMLWIEKTFY